MTKGEKMLYRKFGKLGWEISEIGLGTYAIGGYWGPTDDKESLEVIEKSFELGVNFFDTADIYGRGKSERFIRELFVDNGLRTKIFIATKGGHDFYTSPPKLFRNFDIEYLNGALNRSLERLGTDYVDIYQLHGPDLDVMKKGDIFSFLEMAKKDGRIRAAGLSLYNLEGVQEAIKHTVVDSIQCIVNMLVEKNDVKEILNQCSNKGVAVIARQPLAQSLLTGKYNESAKFTNDDHRSVSWTKDYLEQELPRVEKLKQLVLTNRSLVQSALKFVLSYSNISTVIPGARNVRQLIENLNTEDVPVLTPTELQLIMSI
jgi:aryl-alcohol dehydrogenase-like predicted oxidoreductase